MCACEREGRETKKRKEIETYTNRKKERKRRRDGKKGQSPHLATCVTYVSMRAEKRREVQPQGRRTAFAEFNRFAIVCVGLFLRRKSCFYFESLAQ